MDTSITSINALDRLHFPEIIDDYTNQNQPFMPHFVISHRRAGKTHPDHHRSAIEALHAALEQSRAVADLVHAHRPDGYARHVAIVDTEHGALDPHAKHPDLIVEPLIEHHLGRARQADSGRAHPNEIGPIRPQNANVLPVQVSDHNGQALAGIDVFADYGSGRDRKQTVTITDQDGRARVVHGEHSPIHQLAVAPPGKWWPMVFHDPSDSLQVQMITLPKADGYLGWWHRKSGIQAWDPDRGRGVRVGVIDSGLGQHSALAHANNLGAIVNCQRDPKGGADARGHGTHVCGGIGGRPLQSTEFGGTAPGVDLSALRVFGDDGSAHQADIALALYVMAHEQGCHLVNLSLGTTQRSDLVADAISDARQAGCLTLCATGNGDDAVEYPAALDDSVAVGAVGIDGWGPVGSLAASRKPDDPARMATPWFIGKFSSHGPEVNAVAAGVGIIATVPDDQYAGYSGTSMAAPQLTALLAAALGGHTALNESGSARSEAMLRVLQQHLTDMGLSSDLQGQGRMVVG